MRCSNCGAAVSGLTCSYCGSFVGAKEDEVIVLKEMDEKKQEILNEIKYYETNNYVPETVKEKKLNILKRKLNEINNS
tara:strand:- start:406 stop:639 length:234 start_codon:yes stop_codon:yes gene_type:complete